MGDPAAASVPFPKHRAHREAAATAGVTGADGPANGRLECLKLLRACFQGKAGQVHALLVAGVSPNASDVSCGGLTPLGAAVADPSVVRGIVDWSAGPADGRFECLELLLAANADPDQRISAGGMSALSAACLRAAGGAQAAKSLLMAGAKPTVVEAEIEVEAEGAGDPAARALVADAAKVATRAGKQAGATKIEPLAVGHDQLCQPAETVGARHSPPIAARAPPPPSRP